MMWLQDEYRFKIPAKTSSSFSNQKLTTCLYTAGPSERTGKEDIIKIRWLFLWVLRILGVLENIMMIKHQKRSEEMLEEMTEFYG